MLIQCTNMLISKTKTYEFYKGKKKQRIIGFIFKKHFIFEFNLKDRLMNLKIIYILKKI